MQKPGLFGMNGVMVFLLTCLAFAARAQQQPGYLILVDAENKQPFAVRVGDQSYFSSGHGHLTLSQLRDSTYKLGFRFPRKNIAEQIFTVVIHRKDQGFQLKGNDTSLVLFNWQSKEIIRPVYEKDSSRMLEQGTRRDDGFSRLMAAVVNDTAVMYNTYAGNGFEHDSSLVNTQNQKARTQNPAADSVNMALSQMKSAKTASPKATGLSSEIVVSATPPQIATSRPGGQHNQPATVSPQSPVLNKDSLLAVKRLAMHLRDSLNTAQKISSKDSLIAARKQQTYLRDSLNTARKASIKDSIAIAKKRQSFLKDSLVVARKAAKDSLTAARKNGNSTEELLAAKKIQQSKDSLLAVDRKKAMNDSLLASKRADYIKDSLELLSRSTATSHRSSLTRIKKLREVSLKISRKMVFLDIGKNGRADTITLFVYFESADTVIKKRPGGEPMVIKKPLPPESTGVKKVQMTSTGSDTTGVSKTAENRNSDSTGLSRTSIKNNNADGSVLTKTAAKNRNPDTSALGKAIVKKNPVKPVDAVTCSQTATESDSEALRSAIIKANSEQEKIAVAAGAFAMKCFSVSQVRFLASLLVSDKAKYGLMDAAHLHVVDPEHFPELVDLLSDKNFQRKFLIMAEKRS